jgi:hypothetical protein
MSRAKEQFRSQPRPKRFGFKGLVLLYAVGCTGVAFADEPPADAAQSLLATYAALEQRLQDNQFLRPVVLDSLETAGTVAGEIYAVIPHPFASVSAGLNDPDHWCDVLSLHINTKYCRTVPSADGVALDLYVGRKTPQELRDAERIEFIYTAAAPTATFLTIQLSADEGPLSTHDYLISLEAVPLPRGETFLHLTYSYSMGFLARVAIKSYLATIGSDKVGFTSLGNDAEGEPRLVGGVRALVERNTLRYYLAIDSFLAAAEAPLPDQLETRLQSWFSAVEQYPQLYEMERDEYLAMKYAEDQRQHTTDL